MYKLIRVLFLMIAVMSMVSCISFVEPSYDQGRQSFLDGNYNASFKSLYPAAQRGNADAQYAIGYMYYYGLGTRYDRQAAIMWMQKAANQGQGQAVRALQSVLNSEGQGAVTRPNVFLASEGKQYVPAKSNRRSLESNAKATVPDEASTRRRASWPLPRNSEVVD